MMIDMTVKSARANDAASRRLAEAQRRGIYGETIRIPRVWRDKRMVAVDLANQGHEYDEWLDSWVPPATNEFIIRRQAI